MTAGIWFWILYVISIVMVLIGLLGWGVFGAPIR
jgi:hypothetical protein